METYLKILPWIGRVASLLALFVPYGVYLAAMGLVLTETFVLVQKLVKTMEKVLLEE